MSMTVSPESPHSSKCLRSERSLRRCQRGEGYSSTEMLTGSEASCGFICAIRHRRSRRSSTSASLRAGGG